ncbi:molybdopterin converting factor subunit 1 [Kordiimonas aestuarii]|uniref:molybdopterin converting factor subunit 1 n=1 Tax=Kordiimonas aestuarii TaxID=1005925 RepID=UPI0021D21509|nr:molybdopterin converting factor subunit 1 [Kordiimonas aestuarii]
MLQLLYFSWVRERTGTSEEQITLPDGIATVSTLVGHLRAKNDRYAAAFEDMKQIRIAVNQRYVDPDAAIKDGDEIAFFPPVTGG